MAAHTCLRHLPRLLEQRWHNLIQLLVKALAQGLEHLLEIVLKHDAGTGSAITAKDRTTRAEYRTSLTATKATCHLSATCQRTQHRAGAHICTHSGNRGSSTAARLAEAQLRPTQREHQHALSVRADCTSGVHRNPEQLSSTVSQARATAGTVAARCVLRPRGGGRRAG